MHNNTVRYRDLAPLSAADAARRIEDWFRRGYIMFSDMVTRSTHLKPVPARDHGSFRSAG